MISRLLLAPIILLISSPALSEVDKEIHEMCLPAADYKGCVSINQSQPKLDTTVNKEETNTSSELEAEQNQEDAEDSSKQASPKKLSAYGITDYRTAFTWCKKNLNGIDNDIFKTNDPFDKKTISESDFCRQYFIKVLQSANGEICGECDLDPNIILTNSSEELKQSLESNYIKNSLIEDSSSIAKVNNENLLNKEITQSAISPSETAADDSEEKTLQKKCIQAKDYLGCLKAYTTKSIDIPSPGVIQGKRKLTGNSCPSGWAYLGSGYCQQVRCVVDNWGSNDQVVAGKGWRCPVKKLIGRGHLVLGDSPIPALNNEKCPNEEPEIGKNNSCLNRLSEEQIFAHEMASTQRASKVPVNWRRNLRNLKQDIDTERFFRRMDGY